MAEPVLLSALQTNLDWARSSAKSAPIGCAVASAQRSGSTTPYCCTVTTVANRDYIVLPHSTGLAALQVASPLTVTPLPLVQFPPDGQIISVDVIQVPLTAGSAPSPVLAVAFLTQGTSSAAQSASPSSAAEKESAPRCWLHFYGYRTHAETLTALTGALRYVCTPLTYGYRGLSGAISRLDPRTDHPLKVPLGHSLSTKKPQCYPLKR